MKIIGLTGGIASGKSTVADMLRRRGFFVIDADQLAREVVQPGRPALQEIVEAFGQDVLLPDGTLNRTALADVVFSNEDARRRLEAIIHPRVARLRGEKVAELADEARCRGESPPGTIFYEIPLLFEAGQMHSVDEIWLVWVPRDFQIKRLMTSRGLTREDAERRIQAQMPLDDKRGQADVVIDNSGELQETERQVDEALRERVLRGEV